MEHNVDYFIKKFEAIPEEMWCINHFKSSFGKCALGHCMTDAMIKKTRIHLERTGINHYKGTKEEIETELKEAFSLCILINRDSANEGSKTVININNGLCLDYPQPTPKERILAALYDIKSEDAVKEAQKILNTKTQLQKSMKKTIMLLSTIAIMSACGKSANEPIQADTSIENGSKDKPVITITSLCYNAQFGYRVGFTITNTKPGDQLYGGCVGYGGDTLSIVSLMGLDGDHVFYGTTRESGCYAKVYVADVTASHQIYKEIMPGNCVNCEP